MSVVGSVSSKYYSGFNPLDIGSCELWLDAADSSTLTLSGANVTQWRDKSGNGRNTSTVYGTPQISTSGFNGIQSVYFGSGAGLTGPITNTGALLTVFVVARLGGSTAGRRVFSLGQAKRSDSGLVTDVAALTIGNLATQMGWFRNNANAVVTTIYNTGFVYNLVMNGSTGVIWLNSTSTASTNSSGNFGYSTYGLGVQFDNLGDAVGVYPTLGDGFIAEILVYNSAFTTFQRQQVEGYLARKWGLLGGGGVQSITTFNPTNVTGCALWLDAADSSTFTFSSGSNISQWRDKSGNARHSSQFNTGFATYDGSNRVTITPTGQLFSSIPAGTFSSGVSGFVVFQAYASNAYSALISRTVTFVPAPFDMYTSADVGGSRVLIGNGTAYANGYPTDVSFTNPVRTMYGFMVPASLTWNQSVNGSYSSLTISANPGASYADNGANVVIGSRSDKFTTASVYIYEVILYNSALSTTNRQNIEGYLARKWGLTESLPSTHPYALRGLPSTHPYYSIAPVTRAFAPIDIPGCALWLDAADTTTLTLSGSTVTGWRDKSGTNRTVSFSGTNTYTANTSVNTSNPNSAHFYADVDLRKTTVTYATIFMVHTWSGSALNTQQALWGADNGGGWNRTQILSFPAVPEYAFGLAYTGSAPQVFAVSGVNTASRVLYSATYAYLIANGTFATVNGVSTSTVTEGAAATQTTSASTNFGATALNTNIGSVNFHEIIIYTSSTSNISTVQRQQVEAYLARKWGLIGGGMQTISTFNPTNVTGCQLWLDGADSNSMTTSSTTTGAASLTRYVTTSPQNVLYYGTLTSVSSLTGGTCIMNGGSIGASGSTPTAGFLAPSASSGQWYAYCIDGIYIKVVKIQFVLTGSTLTVQGLSAGYTSNTNNYISTTNSGSTNDTYYAGYTSMSIATSSTAANYGVQSFKMNLSSSTTISIVNQWRDKASNVAFTSSNNPEYLSSAINGVNAINLHANAFFSNSSFTLNAPFTIIGVGLTKIQNGGQATLIGGLTDQYLTLDILASAGTSTLLTWYGYPWRSNNSYVSTSLVQNTATMLGMTLAGAAFPTPYVNGTALSLYQSNSGTVSTITGITVGRRTTDYESTSWSGSIGELLIFNSVLSTTNRQTIEGYLALKWGLQSSLPSTHPYALRGLPSTHPYVYRMPATTVFNPRQISGCTLWYDGADPQTITLVGSKVSSWANKGNGGTSFNLLQSTDANRPSFVQGQGLTFTAASSTVLSSSTAPTLSTATNSFIVFKANNTSRMRMLKLFGNSNIGAVLDTTVPTMFLSTSAYYIIYTIQAGTTYVQSQNVYSASSRAFSLNFTETTSLSTDAAAASQTSLIVGGEPTVYFDGTISEILVYDGFLTTSQKQQIEGYLAWKWGLNGGYSPSIAPFTPTSVTGCQLWLDAADSSTLTLSGSSVTQWNDKSGNGRNATGVNNPTYNSTTNGINFVRTSSQYMTLPDGTLPFNDSSYSYFFIFTPASTVAGQTLIFGGGASVLRDSFGLRSGDAGTGTLQTYWIGYDLQTSTTYNLNVRNFAATYYTSGGSRSVWINFTQGASDTPGVSRIQTAFNNRIGRLGNFSDYLNAQIHEIIVYNTALSTTNRQQIEGYLANKWGLTGSLPSSHPYANRSLPNTHPYKVIKP